jgi:hypothetical protein
MVHETSTCLSLETKTAKAMQFTLLEFPKNTGRLACYSTIFGHAFHEGLF